MMTTMATATMMTKTMMMTTIMIRTATETTMTSMATSLMRRMRMKLWQHQHPLRSEVFCALNFSTNP